MMDLCCSFQVAVVHMKSFIVNAKRLGFFIYWIFVTGYP